MHDKWYNIISGSLYNQNNSLIGILAVELPISQIDKLLQTVNISQSCVVYLREKSGLEERK